MQQILHNQPSPIVDPAYFTILNAFLIENNLYNHKNFTIELPVIVATITGVSDIVGNEENGGISKLLLQEHKARQIFRKRNISYSLIRAHV